MFSLLAIILSMIFGAVAGVILTFVLVWIAVSPILDGAIQVADTVVRTAARHYEYD
jgi:hypothetical protein